MFCLLYGIDLQQEKFTSGWNTMQSTFLVKSNQFTCIQNNFTAYCFIDWDVAVTQTPTYSENILPKTFLQFSCDKDEIES